MGSLKDQVMSMVLKVSKAVGLPANWSLGHTVPVRLLLMGSLMEYSASWWC